MAIVYHKPSRKLPRGQRIASITNIAQGDTVDIQDILGFPARYIKIATPDAGDSLSIRVNNRYTAVAEYTNPAFGEAGSPDPRSAVEITSKGAQHPIFTITGDTTFYLEEGLEVEFFELVTMTPATGTSVISMVVW